MREKLRSIARSIRLPSICVLCNQFHCNISAVCMPCIELMPLLGYTCKHCAYPLFDGDYLVCGQCIKNTPHFDKTITAYRFEEPLRSLLHQFKYQQKLYLTSFLSQLIINAWEEERIKPQCLIPMPMHPQKIKTRGFNQTVLLTRTLAKKLEIPMDLSSCQKVINTIPQAQLDGEDRPHNIRGAFHVSAMPYQHVALIDDLLTTGSTANELAITVKKTGVERVDLWCCARTT